jgi:hypothetical protein
MQEPLLDACDKSGKETMMQMTVAMDDALAQVAWRYQVDAAVLRAAIMHESAAELAAVLHLEPQVAQAHMARIARAVTVQTDVGAGCALLTVRYSSRSYTPWPLSDAAWGCLCARN